MNVESATTTKSERAFVVQCIREIGPGGGVSGVAFALQSAWRRYGLDVHAFTLRDIGINKSKQRNVSVFRKKARLLWDVVTFSFIGTLRAKKLFARNRVICHNDTLYGSIYVNHGLHRAMLEASGHKYRMLLRNPLHVFLWARERLRFALDLHDRYVCFSESERRLLLTYYPRVASKIRIIPNGVDIKRFAPNESIRNSQRQLIRVPKQAFALIFIGHEYERKGLHTVLDSLCILDRDVWLIVIGGTEDEIRRATQYATERGVADRVRFLGVVREVEDVLNCADCLVMPSSFEAWPLVGLEAMACGLPALLTPVGGIPEYLFDGVNGFLILRDPADIADKVGKLRSDAGQLVEMRARCVRMAADYSWDAIAGRYLKLLGECQV
jgi:glycosyltransferase involved in cell wall biosynthesis